MDRVDRERLALHYGLSLRELELAVEQYKETMQRVDYRSQSISRIYRDEKK